MLTLAEVIEFCLTFPGAYVDHPFDDQNWTVMRRADNMRCFAFIFSRFEHLCINLKSEPGWSEIYRRQYKAVTPAYHMNKRLWNTVILDGSLDEAVICDLIKDSYQLCAGSKR